jgi:hypothetical protein
VIPPAAGFALDAGGGERLRFSDAEFLVRASADTTGGGFTTFPAGFEGFFRELAEADRAGGAGPEDYARVSRRYGITWL